ncbi:MAG: hypothetical protein P8101_17815 [Candidatus Thiodiazotropha sp.]
MNSLFMEILGALIGLVSVLLMLSMVVTALVQASQGVLRLRSRNLLFGLISVIIQHAGLDREKARMKAREILNAKSSPAMEGFFDPKGRFIQLLGPPVSWIGKDQLAKILEECSTIFDPTTRKSVLEGWDTVQKSLSKRFLRNIRIWTIFWSLVVAVVFQVSAPALLSDLLQVQDSQQTTAQMPSLEQIQEDVDANLKWNDQAVSQQIFKKLLTDYPELKNKLDQSAQDLPEQASILDRLCSLHKDDPLKGKVLALYESMVDQQNRTHLKATLDTYDKYRRSLSRLDIEPWSGGWDYYVRSGAILWGNWVGVTITMILLTFGAPFWFRVLRYFIQLRDTLKPTAGDGETANPTGNPAAEPDGSSTSAQKDTDAKIQSKTSNDATGEIAGSERADTGKRADPIVSAETNSKETRPSPVRKKQPSRARTKKKTT